MELEFFPGGVLPYKRPGKRLMKMCQRRMRSLTTGLPLIDGNNQPMSAREFVLLVYRKECSLFNIRYMRTQKVTKLGSGKLYICSKVTKMESISIYLNSALNNRPQYKALGNKPLKLCSYSPEPRTEVYCFRLYRKLSIGHRIDCKGEEALRGQQHIPSKNWPKYPLPTPSGEIPDQVH